jgi:AraC-like DNA-binding protein
MKRLNGFLPSNLQAKVQLQERYNSILRSFLASPLCDHTKVTRIQENKLYLLVDTQAWASNLQYYKKDLAKRFTDALGTPIQSVVIKTDTAKRVAKDEGSDKKPDQEGAAENPHRLRLKELLKKL